MQVVYQISRTNLRAQRLKGSKWTSFFTNEKKKRKERGKLEVSGCETVINFTCGYSLAVWTSMRVTIRTLMGIYGKAQHDDMGYQSILTHDFMR